MDKLKSFLNKKKVNRHFKQTGPGARLCDGTPSTAPSVQPGSMQSGSGAVDRVHASDVAAQAALKRLYANEPTVSSSQKKIQMIAQRELEKEKAEKEKTGSKFADDMKNLVMQEPEVRELDHSNAIPGVKFTCDLIGDDIALPKNELREYLEHFLRDQRDEDPLIVSSLILASLNKSDERKNAVDIIKKYLQNILENQDDPKYRRIRLANRAFQERVETAKGGREVLEAVGFTLKEERATADGPLEPFLIIDESSARNDGRLLQAVELLDQAAPLQLKVARDTKVFTLKDGEKISSPKLPPDFFTVTGEELKKEQERLTVQADRLTTMRTREMREKDTKQADYRYKYTLIRVRTPDRCLVQGVFGVHEPFSSVREWLSALIFSQTAEFSLLDATAPIKEEEKSLVELGLVPAVVLHLDLRGESNGKNVIAEEYMTDAMPFTIN